MTDLRDQRTDINDVRTMRALAHPQRLAILTFLMSGPPRTATECAQEVDASASACSYHLRELQRFGFVERAEPTDDGRSRPWKATAVSFSVGNDWTDSSPTTVAARHAVTEADLKENLRLVRRFLEASVELEPTWGSAVDFHTYGLVLSPEELTELNEQIRRLLKPYRAGDRRNIPDDATAVHVVYQAFPRVPPSS